MEGIPDASIQPKGPHAVRLCFSLQEGFSLQVSNGELELYLPASVLASGIRSESAPQSAPIGYSTLNEEAQRLGFSERTLRNYMKDEKFPFIRMPGGDVRFIAAEVDDWMCRRKVNAKSN